MLINHLKFIKKVKVILFRAEQLLSQAAVSTKHIDVDSEEAEMLELVRELKGTVEALLEGLNDKLIASSHQRKVNKMLADRIQDLERQLATIIHLNPTSSASLLSAPPQTLLANSPASSAPLGRTLAGLDEPLVPVKSYDTNKC